MAGLTTVLVLRLRARNKHTIRLTRWCSPFMLPRTRAGPGKVWKGVICGCSGRSSQEHPVSTKIAFDNRDLRLLSLDLVSQKPAGESVRGRNEFPPGLSRLAGGAAVIPAARKTAFERDRLRPEQS